MTASLCSGKTANIVLSQSQQLTILSLSQMIAVATWPMSGTLLYQCITVL